MFLYFYAVAKIKMKSYFQGYIEGTTLMFRLVFLGKLLALMFKKEVILSPGQLFFMLDPEPQTSELLQAELKN